MTRYYDNSEEDRGYYDRGESNLRRDRLDRERDRERPWNFNEPFPDRRSFRPYESESFRRGRFGERAEYESNEPRYSEYPERYRDPDYGYGRSGYEGEYRGRRFEGGIGRSRLRCRDVMTRDLAVATRDTTLREVGMMMKNEDTGVIPVVEHDANGGNGSAYAGDRNAGTRNNYGKLVGLITDRDIVIRAVTEDKDCRTTRAEEIMSTDILTARPNDRVVDVLQKMAEKQVRRIPVTSDNGILRGMISLGDIALETEADRELGVVLEEISQKPSFWNRIFG